MLDSLILTFPKEGIQNVLVSLSSFFEAFRPVGNGAAWRRSPHQKSAGRERDRKGRKGKKKEREGERERERRKESERESKKACVVGVNTSFELLQNCKRHGKGGGGEKHREKNGGKRCKKRQK